MDVKASLSRLKAYCEQEGYKGWDPYDGLNSALFHSSPLHKSDICRLFWIQLFKRSPFNLRKLFRVPKQHNAKGIGLLLSGYCSLYEYSLSGDRTFGAPEDLNSKVKELSDLLLSMRSLGYSGACWGYNFDWQARRLFLFPKNTPTVVATAFCAEALFKAYEITKNEEYLSVALSSADFVLKDLRRTSVREGFILSYSPLPGNDTVYNASLLGAKLLSLCYLYTKNKLYKSVAKEIVVAACAAQDEKGGWVYGLLPVQSWIDSFHTGYNLEALATYAEYCSDNEFDTYIEKGLDYYVSQFFLEDGTPKYYNNKTYPIDIHCPAQLLSTLSALKRWRKYSRLIDKVLRWTSDHMYDDSGYFYYQLKKTVSSKISYMRWSNAFMFRALALYLLNNYKYSIYNDSFCGSFVHFQKNDANSRNITLTLSTSAPGGIRSVVDSYIYDGLLPAWNGVVLFTHISGISVAKIGFGLEKLFVFFYYVIFKKVRLIHCHVSSYGSFWRKAVFAKLAKALGMPVILHMHGGRFELFYESSSSPFKKAISNVLNNVDRVIVLSSYWESFIKGIAKQSNIFVLPNHVRVPHIDKTLPKDNVIRLVFLGFISENKGVFDLLPAFQAVLNSLVQKNIHLTIAGNGEIDEAKKIVGQLGINSYVDVVGWIDTIQAQELLETADIFVLPSYHEGMPVSVLEAMAWALPVITTPVGAIPELIQNGKNGMLVSPGDQAEFTKAILALCTDSDLRHALGKNARQTIIDKYSDQVVLPRLNSLYRELIGGLSK